MTTVHNMNSAEDWLWTCELVLADDLREDGLVTKTVCELSDRDITLQKEKNFPRVRG